MDSEEQSTGDLRRGVAIVGMMGCGKTTIGRILSRKLKLPFADTDAEIEEAANFSISDIFDLYGEEAFRQFEARVAMRLIDGAPKVLSTGGGLLTNPAVRDHLLTRMHTVWLDVNETILVERLLRQSSRRPLLANSSDPRQTVLALIEERRPIYSQAQLRLRVRRRLSPGQTSHLLYRLLLRHDCLVSENHDD